MILKLLRQHTAALHSALEKKVAVLCPQFSLPEYHDLLQRFFGFYEPFERHLLQLDWQGLPFDYAARYKTPWLIQDLTALGDSQSRLEGLPRCSSLAFPSERPQVLGSLYVIEGSTLGGQVISRHLNETLGLTPRNGAAFFNSYGLQVGQRWQEFGAFLTSASGGHETEVLTGATRTFEILEEWLPARL